jgi:hypothetical protein
VNTGLPLAAPPPQPAAESILARSWALYRAHWRSLAAPLVVAALLCLALLVALGAIAGVALATHAASIERNSASPGLVVTLATLWLLTAVISVAISIWTFTALFGMADAIWERGSATLADGNHAFRRTWRATIVAGVGITGLAVVAVILALPTLGIALLALPLVVMYVPASVVSGGRGGFAAIAESWALVRRNFGSSAIMLVVVVAIGYGVSFVSLPFLMPLEFSMMASQGQHLVLPPPWAFLAYGIGIVVMMVVNAAFYGFYALALTGLYRRLAFAAPPDAAGAALIAPA